MPSTTGCRKAGKALARRGDYSSHLTSTEVAMKKSIVVTDLTRMNPPRICVAGYTEHGECIRPVLRSNPLTQDWLWQDNQLVIRSFAVIEFEFVEKKFLPIPPH